MLTSPDVDHEGRLDSVVWGRNMVMWNEVRSWNAAALAELATRLTASAGAFDVEADRLLACIAQLEWRGAAGDAALSKMRELHGDALRHTDELSRVGRCIRDVATSLYPLSSVVRDCDRSAEEQSMVIDDHGRVRDTVAVYATSSEDAWDTGRERLRTRRDIEERVMAALRRAEEIEVAAVAELSGTADERGAPAPPERGTAPANAAFWDSLTPSQRTSLLVEDPGSIGNLDGIPAQDRDAANRRMLVLEKTRLEGVAIELQSRLDGNVFGGLFDDADAGLDQTRKRLEALDEIARTLDQGNRQLLVLDNSSAEDTLAAIAVGNVHTATHVAVFVPGLDSDVRGDMHRYDEDMVGLRNTVEQMIPAGETAACVTWMDYQAPHMGWSLLDPRRTVISTMAASTGAPRLAGFLDGLDASRSHDPHLSLIGHSYGSLTAALAVRGADKTGVDEMVALGSPGLGFDRIDPLSVPPGHLFVGEARSDPVADVGIFGADPSELDGVRPLATRSDTGLQPSTGHSDYLRDGTAAQHNVALVIAGRDGEVTG